MSVPVSVSQPLHRVDAEKGSKSAPEAAVFLFLLSSSIASWLSCSSVIPSVTMPSGSGRALAAAAAVEARFFLGAAAFLVVEVVDEEAGLGAAVEAEAVSLPVLAAELFSRCRCCRSSRSSRTNFSHASSSRGRRQRPRLGGTRGMETGRAMEGSSPGKDYTLHAIPGAVSGRAILTTRRGFAQLHGRYRDAGD